MIKAVRIFTKSDTLSSGAIIFDLVGSSIMDSTCCNANFPQPGIHDANAARASVADKYIQKCSNIWIVAPVSLAVDDKTAQNLLDRSFRRQLRYDSAESKITFICTKTDDISTKEVIKRLRLGQADEDYKRELDEIDAQSAEAIAKREELLQQEKDEKFAKIETEQSVRV